MKFKFFSQPLEKECAHDEHCPIYLSYLGKYGEHSEEVKLCKNPNTQYCKKYQLINQTDWEQMTIEEKLKVVKDMNIIEYIDKK